MTRSGNTRALVLLGCLTAAGCETGDGHWSDALPRPAYADLERVPVADDWFEVYRLPDDVYALYEPHQFQEVISYLILGEREALLFDTGMGLGDLAAVVDGLTDLPVSVLNSHTHFDHVGGNADFDRVLALDTPYTRAHTAGQPHAEVAGEVAPEALTRPLPGGRSADEYHIRPWTLHEVVGDGTRIDLGGRVLEVLHVPGHTPDALALHDAEAGLLWTGDTFYEGPLWLFVPETDLAAYARSLERLVALVPTLERLHPGHNTPLAAPDRLVALERAYAQVMAGAVPGRPYDAGIDAFDVGGFTILLAADADDWRPLYSGSFDGFRIYFRGQGYIDDPADQDVFVAEPDAIHVRQGTNGLITTLTESSHYHVRVDYRWGAPGGTENAGLMTHVDVDSTVVEDNRPRSVEINMRRDAPGSIWLAAGLGPYASTHVAPGTRQHLAPEAGGQPHDASPFRDRRIDADYPGDVMPTRPWGEWNTLEAIVRGSESLTVILNGQVVNRLHDLRLPSADDPRQPGDPAVRGGIGLQSEGQEVHYRHFEIRELGR